MARRCQAVHQRGTSVFGICFIKAVETVLRESRLPLRFAALVNMVWILQAHWGYIWRGMEMKQYCQRNGPLAISFVGNTVVHKSSPPTTESVAEIRNSGLLEKLQRPERGKLSLFLDGNKNWGRAAAGVRLDGGTMSIDPRWRSLDRYLPQGLHARAPDRSTN